MTKKEWLVGSAKVGAMLAHLGDRLTPRKHRLLVVGVCRQYWDWLREPARAAVEVAERFADGQATELELDEAHYSAYDESVQVELLQRQTELLDDLDYFSKQWQATTLAYATTFPDSGVPDQSYWRHATALPLLRDLFRYSTDSIVLPATWPTWREGTVVQLAEAIYAERAFDRLPILADALEEAGCTHGAILHHLRSPGPHTRGCWPLDLLLGKT